MYPGIPSDYRSWPEEEKQSWAANYPTALAIVESERDVQDVTTDVGLENRVMNLTGSKEQASAARGHVQLARKKREMEARLQ